MVYSLSLPKWIHIPLPWKRRTQPLKEPIISINKEDITENLPLSCPVSPKNLTIKRTLSDSEIYDNIPIEDKNYEISNLHISYNDNNDNNEIKIEPNKVIDDNDKMFN